MRRTAFALVVLAATQAPLAACGGSQPATQAPAAGSPGPAAAPGVAATSGDAGPTTTTTQSLGAAAGGGTKLTPLASADGGTEAKPVHKGEPGRTVVDIRTIIESHRDEARACYDNALVNHTGIEGTLDIRWTIDPTGKVTEADVDTSKSEIVEPAVSNCIIAIVKGIHWNASPKGFETKAHYPFNFHPRKTHTVGN